MSNNVKPSATKTRPAQHRFTLLIIALLVIGVGAPVLVMTLGGTGALLTKVAVAISLLAALENSGVRSRKIAGISFKSRHHRGREDDANSTK